MPRGHVSYGQAAFMLRGQISSCRGLNSCFPRDGAQGCFRRPTPAVSGTSKMKLLPRVVALAAGVLGCPWRTGRLVWVTGSAGVEKRRTHPSGILEEILVASCGFVARCDADTLTVFCQRLCRTDFARGYSVEELSKAWEFAV